MRNCIGMRTEQCSSGKEILVSVASAAGKRIATAQYAIADGQWKLTNAKGPMNRELAQSDKKRLSEFAWHIGAMGTGEATTQINEGGSILSAS